MDGLHDLIRFFDDFVVANFFGPHCKWLRVASKNVGKDKRSRWCI